jgi:hypothetical protein
MRTSNVPVKKCSATFAVCKQLEGSGAAVAFIVTGGVQASN